MFFLPVTIFFLNLLLLYLPSGSFSVTVKQSKRDASPPLAPATLFVPVNFDGNNRYVVNVSLPSGSQSQPFSFALTTSTGYSSVAGSDCSSCGGGPAFSPSSSIQSSAARNVSVLDGNIGGQTMAQACNLMLQNGSSWTWTDENLIVANQSSSIFSSGTPGIMGLGTNSRDGTFNQTPMAFWLKDNPTQTNFSFGMALNPPDGTSSTGGTLHWLAPDEDSYEGEVVWKTLVSANTSSLGVDSFVEMDSWAFQNSKNLNINDNAGSLLTIVDPFFNNLIFPQDEARSIYGAIIGSSRQLTVGTSTVYTLPCDTKMQLKLTFGTVSVTLTETQLVRQAGNNCVGVLEEWSSENVTEYLLGASLVSNIYLIFQGSGSSSSFGFANRKSTSPPLNAVSIAGLALGGAAFLIMVGIAVFLFIRWRRNSRLKKTSLSPRLISARSISSHSSRIFGSDETSDLLPRPLTPISPGSPHYILRPAGGAPGYQRESKRDMMQIERLNVMNASSTGYSPHSSYMRSHEQNTPNSDNSPIRPTYLNSGRERSPGLFIRVSPPSLSGHVIPEQVMSAPFPDLHIRNDSVSSLPPYQQTDPDPRPSILD